MCLCVKIQTFIFSWIRTPMFEPIFLDYKNYKTFVFVLNKMVFIISMQKSILLQLWQ